MIRVGINGFGRIGRTCFRILAEQNDIEVVAINDVIPSEDNLCYLLNYDSQYGPLSKKYCVKDRCFVCDDHIVSVYHEPDISEVDWKKHSVQIIIDSSGITDNILKAYSIPDITTIITHSPECGVENYIVMGVNESDYISNQKVISSSICDVNGAAHVIKPFMKEFGIKSGFTLTLHPWLSYQNLVDGPVAEQRNPKHFWKDFSLGRSSIDTLIPKPTTFLTAMEHIVPSISEKMDAISYRTPTSLVSVADMTFLVERSCSVEKVNKFLSSLKSDYVRINKESLVGRDYMGMDEAVVIDLQWTRVVDHLVHIVCWYDNEWSYSSSVIKLVRYIGG